MLPFLEYAVEGFVDGLREQLQWVQAEQLGFAWRDYVRSLFGEAPKPSEQRRADLALAMAEVVDPLQPQGIRRLTPALAEAYATKTGRTLLRDLHELVDMGLLKSEKGGYCANMEQMTVFLPARRRREA